ncbi:ankyrin repeat-containing domain protein [Coprinopsis sp. MPI-PUGE-AT-0042]|nr:ankyrin repeat-containing domain protein [Coprinopsis sp. MPI-PUGE-AT-0042]
MLTPTRPLIQAILRCNAEEFASLLQTGEDYLDTDSQGWTALHWAVSRGQTDIIRMLLEHHKSHQSSIPSTSTHDLASYDYSRPSAARDLPHPVTPLELAASNDDREGFELLLEHLEAEGSAFNALWSSPLPVNTYSTKTSNFWCTREDVGKYLEESRPWNSRTRLAHLAIYHDKYDVLRLLIESGADINGRYLFSKQTPLHTAAFQRNPKCTRILLAAGADPTLVDDFGRTALQQAMGHGYDEVAIFLIEAGAPVDMCPSAYQFAPFARAKIPADASPLMLACGLNNVDPATQSGLVTRLLKEGADANASDRRGRTALHVAAAQCDIDIVQSLLNSGANASAKSYDGRTVYHYFAQRQHSSSHPNTRAHLTEVLQLLLSHRDSRGEDLYDASGTHPLEVAAEASQPTIFRVLVDHAFVADKLGTLHGAEDAAAVRDTLLLELLLPEEDLKQSDTDSMHPLQGLIPSDLGLITLPQETVDSILATIHLLDSAGGFTEREASNALRLVVQHFRNPDLSEVLLDCGAQVLRDPPDAWDLIQDAAQRRNHEVLRCLLDHGGQSELPDHCPTQLHTTTSFPKKLYGLFTV